MRPSKTIVASAIIALAFMATSAQGQTVTLRVDADNSVDTGDGSAWGSSAFKYLSDALDQADLLLNDPLNPADFVNIWLMGGTTQPYVPTNTVNRHATFDIVPDVSLYGGFEGDETLREDRVFDTFGNPTLETILSGDLDGDTPA